MASKLDFMGSKEFSMTNFETPSINQIPNMFKELLNYGSEMWDVEMFGFNWVFATLQEYEARTIYRKLSNIIDSNIKARLLWVETLTRCIMEATKLKNGETAKFHNEEDKMVLRHILLSLDTKTIEALYKAYARGEKLAIEKFNREFPDIKETLHKDFFDIAGSSSKN